MARLIHPNRRSGYAPQWPFDFNHQSPQAVGLVAWYPLDGYNPGWTPFGPILNPQNGSPNRRGDTTRGLVTNFGNNTAIGGQVPGINSLNELTISVWVRRLTVASSGFGRWFQKGSSFLLFDNGDTDTKWIDLRWASQGEWTWFKTQLGSLTHIVMVYDGVNANTTPPVVWHNGVPESVTTVAAPSGGFTALTTADLTIGNDPTFVREIDGNISDLRFYNRLLSESEMFDLYNAQTRYDLYWKPGTKLIFDLAAAPPAGTAFTQTYIIG